MPDVKKRAPRSTVVGSPAPASAPAPASPPTRLLVGPFNRVEGDLEVALDVAHGRVTAAWVNATMYRGFEQMLRGQHPADALVWVPRICGICSVSQSVAAARALADLAGVTPPPNGEHVTQLMLATENLADHLTHFYVFFAADFCRPCYATQPWYAEVVRRWQSGQGEHLRVALAARQRWFTIMGTLGGKWPHTQAIDPGGSSRAVDAAEKVRLRAKLREFRSFLEQQVFAAPLEEVASLHSEAALWRWCDAAPFKGDARAFLHIARELGLLSMGLGPNRYLSCGQQGTHVAASGLWRADAPSLSPLSDTPTEAAGRLEGFDPQAMTEDVHHAWMQQDDAAPQHPFSGQTRPDVGKAHAYTWNKAPRWHGEVVETGAMARQLVQGHPLMRDAVARHGGSVFTRVLARLWELALTLPKMELLLQDIRPQDPFCVPTQLPHCGQGQGFAEAARGSLGHWLVVAHGRIQNYQIIAPTSWNFSPRDAQGTPGALEQALVGLPIEPDGRPSVAVQHVVRSFDPCMVCTVH